MNLACLLMTLVCLVTILLFSNVDRSHHQTATLASLKQRRNGVESNTLDAAMGSPLESIDSLDRQPLERQKPSPRPSSDEPAPAASDSHPVDAGDNTTDGFSLLDDRHDDPTTGVNRSDRNHQELAGAEAGEREVEDTGAPKSASGPSEHQDRDTIRRASSLIDPILSQVLDDFDSFGLFKALTKDGANSTMKPIIRRSANGATIIISSSGLFGADSSASNLNDSSIPSLLEKMLPPMLRPLSLLGAANSPLARQVKPSGFATITINSEPIVSSSSNILRPFAMPPFDPFPSPFMSAMRASSSPLAMPLLPPLSPPSSLLSMIMRAAEMHHHNHHHHALPAASGTQKAGGPAAFNNSENLNAQASQLNQTTLAPNGNTNSSGSPSAVSEPTDNDVETFDVNQVVAPARSNRPPFQSFYSSSARRTGGPGAGSMIVISSSAPPLSQLDDGSNPRQVPFPFPVAAPFGSHPLASDGRHPAFMIPSPFAPQMLVLGTGGAASEPPAAHMSPILRAILNNVMSDLSAEDKSRGDKSAARRSGGGGGGSPATLWPAAASDDSDDEWDERESRRLRARHRSVAADGLEDQQEAEGAPVAEVVNGLEQQSGSIVEQLLESAGGFTGSAQGSGTIKQTFRGPGVTVERVFELPAAPGRRADANQNPLEGVRSQSISRMDSAARGADSEQAGESLARPIFAPRFRAPAFARMMSHESEGSAAGGAGASLPAPIGLIGRLLADLRPKFGETTGAGRFSGIQLTNSRQDLDEDLDEGDSVSAADEFAPLPRGALHWSPKIRVGSARVRMSSHMANRRDSSSSFFVPTAAHFSFPAGSPHADLDQLAKENNNEREEPSGKHKQPANSFEDTIGSLDDLSVFARAHHHPNHKPLPAEQASDSKTSNLQQQQLDSPFTSPSSPLFGFPAMASEQDERQTASKLDNGGTSINNRRQRAFTYHSNHEIAGSQSKSRAYGELARQQTTSNERQASETVGRARFASPPALPPPAAIIMGRRLDDGPFASHHHDQAQAQAQLD